jgi:hypothetical protein
MAYVKLTYKFDPNSVEIQPVVAIPTVTESISASPTPEPEISIPDQNQEKYPAWKLLPYYGEGFVVDRYVAPMTMAVKPKGLDKKLVETEVRAWLEDNKFDAIKHKIQWE